MNKRYHRTIIALLLASLMFLMLPGTALAAEEYGFEVLVEPSQTAIGEKVTLTFRLTDYDDTKVGISGFQIDVQNTGDLLQSAAYASLVTDEEGVFTNNIWYSSAKDRLSYMYAKNPGYVLDPATDDLMELTLTIPSALTEAGTFTFPVTMYIYTAENEELTYTMSVDVSYGLAYHVEITWGDLAYTYSDGVWNTQTHAYTGTGWSVDAQGGDQITVTNNGIMAVTAVLTYSTERTDIQGSFDREQLALETGETETAVLTLSGQPAEAMEKKVIGTVTVTLE